MSMNLGKGMRFLNSGRVKEVKVDGKVVRFKFSTYRKYKDRSGQDVYSNSAWFGVAVGKAAEKIRGLADKTRIKIVSGYVENRAYKDKNSGALKFWLEIVVFDVELDGEQPSPDSSAPAREDGVPF